MEVVSIYGSTFWGLFSCLFVFFWGWGPFATRPLARLGQRGVRQVLDFFHACLPMPQMEKSEESTLQWNNLAMPGVLRPEVLGRLLGPPRTNPIKIEMGWGRKTNSFQWKLSRVRANSTWTPLFQRWGIVLRMEGSLDLPTTVPKTFAVTWSKNIPNCPLLQNLGWVETAQMFQFRTSLGHSPNPSLTTGMFEPAHRPRVEFCPEPS